MATHKIDNPDKKVWRVFKSDVYEQIESHWAKIAENKNTYVFMLDGYSDDLNKSACATFETRKAARAYVENMGGTWK